MLESIHILKFRSSIKSKNEVKSAEKSVREDNNSTIAESPSTEILPHFTDLPVIPKKK